MSSSKGLIPEKSIEVLATKDLPELDLEPDMTGSQISTHEPSRQMDLFSQSPQVGEDKQVSVIIPFSRADKVGNAIASVMAQEYPEDRLEIIVVGKGSSAIQENWPTTAAIDEGPILQPGKARNLGASKATGDVLLFLDDDCEAQPGWIEENLAELENEEVGAVSGMIRGKSAAYFARCVDLANFGASQKHQRWEGRLWSATFGIRRELFEMLDGFNEDLRVQEDLDICFRLWRSGYSTVYQPKVEVLHNHGRNSLASLISYQFENGRRSGLLVEAEYSDTSLRNSVLAKIKHPIPYFLALLPLALVGTLTTILGTARNDPRSLALSPFVLAGKLSCHIGILRSLVDDSLRGTWIANGLFQAFATIFEYGLLKNRFRTPRVLTLYVTSACNAKCQHCFYWQNLNQKADLTLGEMAELSQSLGKIDKLLITGGEPFLRRELPEILELFFENNRVRNVSIPTNGLTPKLIHRQLKKVLLKADGRTVRINFSLDGTESVHDEIRAVLGNYKKVIETYNLVRSLQDEFHNLSIGINSCVMDKNYEDLFAFYDEMPASFPEVDLPGLILLRGDPLEKTLELPDVEALRKLHKHKTAKIGHRQPLPHRLADAANFNVGLKTIKAESQVVPCEAGRILGVVEDNGDVRHCELLPPIGNLREKGFVEIWTSPEAQAARQKIVKKECRCTHECNVYESMMAHPVQALKVLAQDG